MKDLYLKLMATLIIEDVEGKMTREEVIEALPDLIQGDIDGLSFDVENPNTGDSAYTVTLDITSLEVEDPTA